METANAAFERLSDPIIQDPTSIKKEILQCGGELARLETAFANDSNAAFLVYNSKLDDIYNNLRTQMMEILQ